MISKYIYIKSGLLGISEDFSPERSLVRFLGSDKIGALVSGQMTTLVGRLATPVISASGTQPADQGWGKKACNCKEIARGSRRWRASPILACHHSLRTLLRTDEEFGISDETGLVLRLSRVEGWRGLMGWTPTNACSHGLTELHMVINSKPDLELEYS